MWQSHLSIKKVFIGHKEFGGSNQKCFDHHATYVGYSVTDVLYRASKVSKEVWELALRKSFHNCIPFNAPLQKIKKPSINSLRHRKDRNKIPND